MYLILGFESSQYQFYLIHSQFNSGKSIEVTLWLPYNFLFPNDSIWFGIVKTKTRTCFLFSGMLRIPTLNIILLRVCKTSFEFCSVALQIHFRFGLSNMHPDSVFCFGLSRPPTKQVLFQCSQTRCGIATTG